MICDDCLRKEQLGLGKIDGEVDVAVLDSSGEGVELGTYTQARQGRQKGILYIGPEMLWQDFGRDICTRIELHGSRNSAMPQYFGASS